MPHVIAIKQMRDVDVISIAVVPDILCVFSGPWSSVTVKKL